MIEKNILEHILNTTEASSIKKSISIQTLWSGYGEIIKVFLSGSMYNSVIVKHIKLESVKKHPRGWNTSFSHKRKLKSYRVEANWYLNWNKKFSDFRMPKTISVEEIEGDLILVMEDLDSAGFNKRCSNLNWPQIQVCIKWLANFHAYFMNENPSGLWNTGTYWHLDTRPDELKALSDKKLKGAAYIIDQELKGSPFQTIVHGDAKLANFCFSSNFNQVAAVDFQYVGGGCGMKDLAYFVGSCLNDKDSEKYEKQILSSYFSFLKQAVKKLSKKVDYTLLETNWRELYPVAWADFHRFLKGWSPGHWKINSYSEKVSNKVIDLLKPEKNEVK